MYNILRVQYFTVFSHFLYYETTFITQDGLSFYGQTKER